MEKTEKIPTSFRITGEAKLILKQMSIQLGIRMTNVLELALREFRDNNHKEERKL